MSGIRNAWDNLTPGRRVIALLFAGLLLRLCIAPFITYDYDIYAWALVISNIESGNGLYDLTGLYYTPVWGYCLSFIGSVMNAFTDIGVFGIRFTDLLPIEDNWYSGHIATLTTVGFSVAMKIPLMIADLLVGYLIYILLKDYVKDEKRALKGAALWIFCPIVFYMSTVGTQFDCFSALFLLLTVMLLRRNMNLLAGFMFALSCLLKFFPLFTATILIAYIIAKHRHEPVKQRGLDLAMFLIGTAAMALIIFLPDIVNGDLAKSAAFITSRFGSFFSGVAAIKMSILMVLGIVVLLFATYRTYSAKSEKTDDSFFRHLLMILTPVMMTSLMPQYAIVIIPLLIVMTIKEGRAYLLCLVTIAVSTVLDPLAVNNAALTASLVEWYGIGNANELLWLMSRAAADINIQSLILLATLIAEALALMLTFVLTIQPVFTDNILRRRSKKLDAFFDVLNAGLNKLRGYTYEP